MGLEKENVCDKRKQTMKIAFLSFYNGEVYRGVETYVHELCNRLCGKHTVVVYQNGPELPGSKYKTTSTFQKYRTASSALRKFTMTALKKMDKDTDIVVSTNGGWQSFPARIWCWVHGKKLIIPGQSGPGFSDRMNLLTFPDTFVTLTNHQKDWAKRINPCVKVVKIPNGVDLEKFSPKGKGINFNLPKPIILSVGALVSIKRLDLAIKAVSKLEKGSLVLIGRGEEQKEIEKLGNKLLPGRCKMLSFQHSDMPKVYKEADVFTYPTSSWESFGIAMLEAMATNIPVVTNDDPIRREIVGDAGVFVNPEDTDAYMKALEKALGMKWSNKPRKQAEKFSWDKIAQEYDKLFTSLV